MASNQQQIIEQAKFTYSPLGKAFDKQTQSIKDQGEKRIKAIQDKRPIKSIEKFTYDINDSSIVLKEKEIYNELTEESFEKINNQGKRVDIDKLQSNLYKTTTLGTTQKWSSWTGGRLIKHPYKTTTNQIWSFLAGC